MFSPLAAEELPPQFNGLAGASLRAAIGAEYAPLSPCGDVVDMKGGTERSRYFDPFSGREHEAQGWKYGMVVPAEWMPADNAPTDMYNMLMLSDDVAAVRKDFPFGKVEDTVFDNGIWRAGTTSIDGLPVNFYEPPEEFRGDFARIFFYYVAVYSPSVLMPRAYTMLDGSKYPGLTEYGQSVLMEYHRADPVSEDELRRTDVIAGRQGNRNPFVAYPVLAEYLWGERKDESVFIPGQPVPLRGVYSISDERIDLVSEYVPSDAAWTVDGRRVTGNFLVPAHLGAGNHQLRYTSPSGAAGMLMIKITEP